jgi:hypothetical protein
LAQEQESASAINSPSWRVGSSFWRLRDASA